MAADRPDTGEKLFGFYDVQHGVSDRCGNGIAPEGVEVVVLLGKGLEDPALGDHDTDRMPIAHGFSHGDDIGNHMGILEGVTRNSVIDLAREAGMRVEERVFTRHDLYIADECFLTGTAAEVIPVVKIDQRPIGDGQPGKITQKLIAAFRQFANSYGTRIYPAEV